ncbi:MAG TPA: septum formation initiator family protein [Spirochaetia bacterium]|nr:septum formation initiator family protein [Spirochaetia bacterium]
MRRILLVLILCFSIASLLIYLLGDSGLLAYARLSRYHRNLAANVENLRQRNTELQSELTGLQKGRERTTILARSIDLYTTGDRVIQIEGMGRSRRTVAVGDLLSYNPPAETRSAAFKAGALLLAVVLLAGVPFARRWMRRREHGT